MQTAPFVIERVFDAPADIMWKAITDKSEMKKWYFDLEEFRPEPGFQFSFVAGDENRQYVHLCEVKEVVPQRKISYTWKYEGYEGESKVTFELFAEGNKTRLKLTHEGLETFPASNPDLARKNFEKGWIQIIGTSLNEYVGKVGHRARN